MAKIIKQEIDQDNFGDITFDEYPTITLHTRSGAYMWEGREKAEGQKYIMAFEYYLKKLRNIQNAAKEDDPWADKAFLESEIAIADSTAEIQMLQSTLEEAKANHHSRLMIPNASVSKTVTLNIRQHSVLGWRALELLLIADDVVKLALEAHHVARITQEQKIAFIRKAEAIVRSILKPATKYEYTGVTRDDVAANNQKSEQAKQKMGRIESEYLTAEKRSKYAPPLPSKRRNVMPEFKNDNANKSKNDVAKSTAAA